ncbi:pectin lyase fold/virulence factor [Infundibulicybe gibba]|nr:pectin lyase fold/virulence factor [Infundibulicybe gibba]
MLGTPNLYGVFFVILLAITHSLAATTVQTYPRPPIYLESEKFALEVDGKGVPVTAFEGYSYAHFMFSGGAAKIKLTATSISSITLFKVSPQKYGYGKAETSGNSISFDMDSPRYLIAYIRGAGHIVIAADPIESNPPPSSGKNIFNVRSQYDADDSGKSLSTGAFNAATKAAGALGKGAIIYVPPGIYRVGNIILPSSTSLYLAAGSVLVFTGNKEDYTNDWEKKSQGLDGTEWIRTDYGSSNVKVFGYGTIDANGAYGQKVGKFICHAMVPIGTRNFVLDGPIIRDGGSWTVMPTRSSNVLIDHTKVFNRMSLSENDGINVQESQHVQVKNSIAIALDDTFTTKTWNAGKGITVNYPGSAQPLNNVTFINNIAWTHCYAFKVGQGVWETQSNVRFEGGTVYSAAWGKSEVNGVEFTDIVVESLHGGNDKHQTWLAIFVQEGVKGFIGPIKNARIWDVSVLKRGKTAALAHGVAGAMVSDVKLRNIYFQDLEGKAKHTVLQGVELSES